MTASPISDLNPIFLAAGIKLNLCSLTGGTRKVIMDDNFFTGYRRNIVKPTEVLVSIEVPYSEKVFFQSKPCKETLSYNFFYIPIFVLGTIFCGL